MVEMGCNVYRFSIGWSRFFPTGDEDTPNEAGLKFYDDVISELKKYHMETIITIQNDEMLVYLAEYYDGDINAVRGGGIAYGPHKCDNQTHYNAAHNMFIASAFVVKMGHEMMSGSQFEAIILHTRQRGRYPYGGSGRRRQNFT